MMLLDRVAVASRLGVDTDTVTNYRKHGRIVPALVRDRRPFYDADDIAAVARRKQRLEARFGRRTGHAPAACWRDDAALDAYLAEHDGARRPDPALPAGYFSVAAVAARLLVTKATAWVWVRDGYLPATRFPENTGGRPQWGVAAADLEAFERQWRPCGRRWAALNGGHFMTFETAEAIRAFVAERKRARSRHPVRDAAERFSFSLSMVSLVNAGSIWTTPTGPTRKDIGATPAKRRRQRIAGVTAARRAA